jgi:hypothetical protein
VNNPTTSSNKNATNKRTILPLKPSALHKARYYRFRPPPRTPQQLADCGTTASNVRATRRAQPVNKKTPRQGSLLQFPGRKTSSKKGVNRTTSLSILSRASSGVGFGADGGGPSDGDDPPPSPTPSYSSSSSSSSAGEENEYLLSVWYLMPYSLVHECTRSVIAYYTHCSLVYYTLPGVRILPSCQRARTRLCHGQWTKQNNFRHLWIDLISKADLDYQIAETSLFLIKVNSCARRSLWGMSQWVCDNIQLQLRLAVSFFILKILLITDIMVCIWLQNTVRPFACF